MLDMVLDGLPTLPSALNGGISSRDEGWGKRMFSRHDKSYYSLRRGKSAVKIAPDLKCEKMDDALFLTWSNVKWVKRG